MSSPRQKTVLVASPQPNELEQKKKRQTLERAKANHLSKQLQMRLQYAKLKVEHGWQRQNLNEVENLYFHHSHLRNIRQGAGQRPHYATVTYPSVPPPPNAPPPAEPYPVPTPSAVPDRTGGPSPSASDASSSGSLSPPSQSPPQRALSTAPSSQPHVQAPVPFASSAPTSMNRPPSMLDLSDPNILARLAQLQAQVQIPSQSSSQTISRQPSTTIPLSTGASTPAPQSVSGPVPIPGTFSPHVQFSQPPISHTYPGFPASAYIPQLLLGTSASASAPLYPAPIAHPASTPYNATTPSHPPTSTTTPTTATVPTAPAPCTPIPPSTSVAPTALTYDSFWSAHASSTGPTRALYRTHTGFTASAAPGGNVAMLTPGGHAAVMTAEGVYVGGASSRSG